MIRWSARYVKGNYQGSHCGILPHPIMKLSVSYLAASDAVEIMIGGNETFPTGGQITVSGGLTTAAGGMLSGPAVFTVSSGGKSIGPS